ncbi:hypothetical protein ONZ45_g5944 [Pleurotus djamor]|nr:hypothetical protein ONZ45_g5944 [Pleurotus djamor]
MLARYANVEDEAERLRMEELVADAAGNLYGAGFDTVVSALHSFFLAMVLYPRVQREAQQELDTVLGGSRLPEFNDKASLPYITSIVYEVLRWSPIVPLGGAHLLEQDDEYKGYFLKKGSVVLVNIWSILRDEKDYSNPSVFDPSRFMKGGSLDPDVREPTPAFGFGPR